MLIKNKNSLAITPLRKHALDIIEAGIASVLPETLLESAVAFNPQNKILTVKNIEYDISDGRIFVIGGGKAANLMAEAIEKIIGYENITAGTVTSKNADRSTQKIEVIEAGHPLPDERGIEGIQEMLEMKRGYTINEADTIICLLSGGGSSLMPCPVPGISLEDKQIITGLLLKSGADIYEINTVRKHLSKIKGGRLGKFFSPAQVISLIISDVVADDLSVIASGPTFPDSSTFQDAYQVLIKYNLLPMTPVNIVSYLRLGCAGFIEETPKSLTNCHNHIIGNNRLALETMASKAGELGFDPVILTSEQKGDTAEVALARAQEILDGKYNNHTAILLGGETTPKITDNTGEGGRNQHYAAVSLIAMMKSPGKWLVASVGTDGSDYLPDIAGAIVTDDSLKTAIARGINVQSYIDRFDSYTLFEKLGNSLIETGSTGTNVSDVMLYLLKK
jgi:glycerate 2-kinase